MRSLSRLPQRCGGGGPHRREWRKAHSTCEGGSVTGTAPGRGRGGTAPRGARRARGSHGAGVCSRPRPLVRLACILYSRMYIHSRTPLSPCADGHIPLSTHTAAPHQYDRAEQQGERRRRDQQDHHREQCRGRRRRRRPRPQRQLRVPASSHTGPSVPHAPRTQRAPEYARVQLPSRATLPVCLSLCVCRQIVTPLSLTHTHTHTLSLSLFN
jgi:hypothetical protein